MKTKDTRCNNKNKILSGVIGCAKNDKSDSDLAGLSRQEYTDLCKPHMYKKLGNQNLIFDIRG